MAPDMSVEIRHGVYNVNHHKRGAELTVSDASLAKLRQEADDALDHGEGSFMEVIDERLVIGFEGTHAQATKHDMQYFDIFTLRVEDAKETDLLGLVNKLQKERVAEYEDSPKPMKSIQVSATTPRVETRTENECSQSKADGEKKTSVSNNSVNQDREISYEQKWDEEGNRIERSDDIASKDTQIPPNERTESDSTNEAKVSNGDRRSTEGTEDIPEEPKPQTTNNDPTTDRTDRAEGQIPLRRSDVDVEFIAQMWEQLRRNSTHCRARIQEVDEFIKTVDGSIHEISFVSKDPGYTEYFDVIGTQELEMQYETDQLIQIISHLSEYDDLKYDMLPTYHDELRSKWSVHQAELRNKGDLKESVQDPIKSFLRQIIDEYGTLDNLGANLMADVQNGTLTKKTDGDDRFTSKLAGFIRDDEDEPVFLDPDEFAELNPEMIDAIDAEIREQQEQIREALRNELIPRLERELLNKLEQQSQHTAEETAKRLSETYQSEVYKRADTDGDG